MDAFNLLQGIDKVLHDQLPESLNVHDHLHAALDVHDGLLAAFLDFLLLSVSYTDFSMSMADLSASAPMAAPGRP